jgi:3-isopropylmalate/(R)-2-methylmalate dehydratase small subunit
VERFVRVAAPAAALREANVDTDIIFPARFLLLTSKKGLGRYAFYEWRYAQDGQERPDFVLNRPKFKGVEILVAGDNFGCGSSREQAPWALRDLGVRCVISTSFGEIFYANCFKNGMLPVVVSAQTLALLMGDADAGSIIEVDLADRSIRRRDGDPVPFEVEPWRRDALINGWDEIAVVLEKDGAAIADFEHRQKAARPWLYQGE